MLGAEAYAINEDTGRCNSDRLIDNGNLFMLLVRQNLAKPSYATSQYENAAENADEHAGDKTSRGKRASEGQHNRPCRRRGQTNRCFLRARVVGLEVIGHIVYLPTT